MELQEGIFPVDPAEHPRVVEVWEASVRATHDFLTEEVIQFLKPYVGPALPLVELACVRDRDGRLAGFVGVAEGKLEMLFLAPAVRGRGIGRRLLAHAIRDMAARTVDVNEQNAQAVGFYLRLGAEVVGRSELDGLGLPFPLLHLRLPPPA
jgi:putative acetyltransferase